MDEGRESTSSSFSSEKDVSWRSTRESAVGIVAIQIYALSEVVRYYFIEEGRLVGKC